MSKHQFVTSSGSRPNSGHAAELESGIRPSGYPPISVTFDGFSKMLHSIMEKKFSSEKLNDFYGFYKTHNYALELDYIKTHGYTTVYKWAMFFFDEWTLEGNGNCLKNR
jgi:hypothetical protein